MACAVHRKSLSRTTLFGGIPANRGITACKSRAFTLIRWLIQGAILDFMWLKCLSVMRA